MFEKEITESELDSELLNLFPSPLVFFPNDFKSLPDNLLSSQFIEIPLKSNLEKIVVSKVTPIDWKQGFQKQLNTNRLFLLSLEFIGFMLKSYEITGRYEWFDLAEYCLNSYLNFISLPSNRIFVEKIASADHSTAIRINVLVKYLFIIKNNSEEKYNKIRRIVLQEILYLCAWGSSSENYRPNNHGLMLDTSILLVSYCLGAESQIGQKYRDLSINRILNLARTAFDSDGLCNENTIGYHKFNIDLYDNVRRFLISHNISKEASEELQDIITKATKALQYCVRQDGTVPPIGDSPVYNAKVRSHNECKSFCESGFAVIKNQETYLSLICGSRTEIHKQMDDSSITLVYKGEDIIIDSGSYSYDKTDPIRIYCASSSGHSGVFPTDIDNVLRENIVKRYGKILGAIDTFQVTETGAEIGCWYKFESNGTFVKRRLFVTWPLCISIQDIILTDGVLKNSPKVLRFALGPNVNASKQNDHFVLKTPNSKFELFVFGHESESITKGQTEPVIKGFHSFSNNQTQMAL